MPWVNGPALELLRKVGLKGGTLHICTAFYSEAPLEWLGSRTDVEELVLAIRLDLGDVREWINGQINPEALLNFVEAQSAKKTKVKLFSSATAHAKLFVGDHASITGSANLTMKGFGAGLEVVTFGGRDSVVEARQAAESYAARLQPLKVSTLRQFIEENARYVMAQKRRFAERIKATDEDRLPAVRVHTKNTIAGSFTDFLLWLDRQKSEAAREIADRGRGKGQLSGHIRRNFSGLQQFFLTDPRRLTEAVGENPNVYRLFEHPSMVEDLARFVERNASDEPDFLVDTWKTYLPIECGGRATRRGGTIGNLNRMIPLMARYLNNKAR